jgi:hypothetical protein
MKKFYPTTGILCAFFFSFFYGSVNGQTIIRQSIGTIGVSSTVDNVVIQSSVGQPFSTVTNYQEDVDYRPGFIQPITIVSSRKSLDIKFKVYPNPTSNLIHVGSDSNLENPIISVINIHGQSIYNAEYKDVTSFQIACEDWAVGTYIITIYDQNTQVHISKIIKSN